MERHAVAVTERPLARRYSPGEMAKRKAKVLFHKKFVKKTKANGMLMLPCTGCTDTVGAGKTHGARQAAPVDLAAPPPWRAQGAAPPPWRAEKPPWR